MKKKVEYLCVMTVIVCMMIASELLGEREIIFPEIAALCVGCFLAPALSWRTSYLRMIVCIELCAIAGVLIVCFVPVPLWIQLVIAFAVGQLVLMYSGTSFAPMISAIVLPVMLQTRGIVYPIAAFVLVVAIVAIRLVLERTSVKEVNHFEPVLRPQTKDWKALVFRTLVLAVLSFICVRWNVKFCIAPPLLVAFTELSKAECPAGKKKIQVISLVTLCAAVGALGRWGMVMELGMPMLYATAVIGLAVIGLIDAFQLYFPPAGAMAVLALLIPEEAVIWYPLEVLIGISLLTLAAGQWVRISES